jgi:hypothetical protein
MNDMENPMNTRRNDLSPSEIERLLYESNQFIDALFPQSEADVDDLQVMFGTTPVDLPERLREPEAVLDRIIKNKPGKPKPSAFGKLITMLRTEKKLTIKALAEKLDLDAEDLQNLEAGCTAASPLAVTVLAEFFNLQTQKVIRMAGLTQESADPAHETLSVAAYAKPNFDALTTEEKSMFRALVKQLRTKDKR